MVFKEFLVEISGRFSFYDIVLQVSSCEKACQRWVLSVFTTGFQDSCGKGVVLLQSEPLIPLTVFLFNKLTGSRPRFNYALRSFA